MIAFVLYTVLQCTCYMYHMFLVYSMLCTVCVYVQYFVIVRVCGEFEYIYMNNIIIIIIYKSMLLFSCLLNLWTLSCVTLTSIVDI